MKKILAISIILIIVLPVYSNPLTTERTVSPLATPVSLNINFNGETIRGYYLLLDFRTDFEKETDLNRGRLSGDVIIFLHGHAQRPGDAYSLTSNLALKSKSGIVLIPVCDTPYGADKEWRGDRGKEAVLMDIASFALLKLNIEIQGFRSVTGMKTQIESAETADDPVRGVQTIKAKTTLIGWSHGALLGRRIAHSYPDAVDSLVQFAPAGFDNWGSNSCSQTTCLASGFTAETFRIGAGFFRGEGKKVSDAGCGIIRGVTGDSIRSCSSCLGGNFTPMKIFRPVRDVSDTSVLANDDNFPLPSIKYITVIFSSQDGLFRADKTGGIKNRTEPSQQEIETFFEKFYPSAVKSGASLSLKALPGNHIGPSVYSDQYSFEALNSINQLH